MVRHQTSLIAIGAVALASISLLTSSASADLVGNVFEITATSSQGTASFFVALDPDGWNRETGTYNWSLASDTELRDGEGDMIAMLKATGDGTSVQYVQDPQVSLNFTVVAGAMDTMFTISSALLTFPDINPANATASAGMTITDIDGNGADLTGLQGGGKSFLTQYNGLVPAGTDFAALVDSFSTPDPFATAVNGEGTGPFMGIGGPISSMSSQFMFELSANDQASGTSTFVILPAPAGLALLAMAGIAGPSRRRRRV